MSNEKLKMTGKYWIGKGSLSGQIEIDGVKTRVNVGHGEEIPEGLLDDLRLKYFEDQKMIGEKIVASKSTEVVSRLKDRIKELELAMRAKNESAPSGKAGEKIKELKDENESLKESVNDLKSENDLVRSAVQSLANDYPDFVSAFNEAIEKLDSNDESVLVKIKGWFGRES